MIRACLTDSDEDIVTDFVAGTLVRIASWLVVVGDGFFKLEADDDVGSQKRIKVVA